MTYNKETKELIGHLESACLQMAGFLEELQTYLNQLAKPEMFDMLRKVRGEIGVEYLSDFVTYTLDSVAEAAKNLAFIVKWIQCLKGESKTGCSPDLLEKARLSALNLQIAFSEKRYNPPYYSIKGGKAEEPFLHYKTLKTYILQALHAGYDVGDLVELFDKPEDFLEEYTKLAHDILTYVNLIINNFVLRNISKYLIESHNKEAEKISEENIPEELFEEEL